ncbi:sensor histidine kinase KdpD [Pseudomonas sp. 31-12]|uniref:sensor histidine kinase n=1 Tax=Pseudomonas sp. 31-12 TaxID=2201356 RepID=UPI002113A930|nr:HAMP domain-containing sensor histidine kinase [Pseudomonas sp. 31-12]
MLAALQKELSDASNPLVDSQQIEQVIEADQQLVPAKLLVQSDAVVAPRLEEQRMYQELREANAQLVIAALSAQDLQAVAERALSQQKSILATVAHELRNPLTPISMIAERMVRMPSDELPRMRELIEGQVQHMSQLVDDLLDVSRVSTGKLRLNRRDVDMIQVLREAIDACRPLMSAQEQRFDAHLPDGILMVNGDPGRLAQIIHNLLANAAKYTPPHGGIALSLTVASDVLKIKISDNGIGISAKALPFIFDPYIQDVHAVGFNGSGLGIGLTVVRELVEAHGGKVTGMSEGDGKGSEFVVTLPLAIHSSG